jgi:hypothetical protein
MIDNVFDLTEYLYKPQRLTQEQKDAIDAEESKRLGESAVYLGKHLPGQHDQSEHGNRGDSGDSASLKLGGNASNFKSGNNKEMSDHVYAIAKEAVATAQVGHIVKTVEVVTPLEMSRRMKEYGIVADRPICGYQYKDVIAVNAGIDPKLAEATVLHEVAHAAAAAYPSLQNGFLDYMKKEAPEELTRMQKVQEKLGYAPHEMNDEVFADLHAVANTAVGQRWYPVASARLSGNMKGGK